MNVVYNIDCISAMHDYPDKYFDLAVVDPPYFSGPERRKFYGSKVSTRNVRREENMCQYCDDKTLPCLMCGRACMEYQLDRTRCRGCAKVNRPPDVWPVFRFCPYCGRDLGKQENQNENQNQGEEEMARLVWTPEMDETVRRMDADGASDAEICKALGIEKLQLKNRRYNLMHDERKNNVADNPEPEGIRDRLEAEQRSEPPAETERCGAALRPAELSPTEQEMARMIEEREQMLQVKEAELEKARQEVRWFQDKLDPLEKEMARMIEEREQMLQVKEAELEKARQEVRWFQDKLDEKILEGERLCQKLAEKDRIIVKMVAEIYGEV